jgi:hypothetical protein
LKTSQLEFQTVVEDEVRMLSEAAPEARSAEYSALGIRLALAAR